MLKAEDYRVDTQEVNGQKVNITSYKIGDRYYCHVANVDPGATIARTDAPTQQEAIQAALARARERLSPKPSQ